VFEILAQNVQLSECNDGRLALGFVRAERVPVIQQDNFKFEPIPVNDAAPKGACLLRTFDDIQTCLSSQIHQGHRIAPHWAAVRQHLQAAHFGARCAEVHEATRYALGVEGWLDS
jgi:hypothetical protein